MKTRIVERKCGDGTICYIIQRRRFWVWQDFKLDTITHYDFGFGISSKAFVFRKLEDAQFTLRIFSQIHSHKGIRIYPTNNPYVYYSLYGSKKSSVCSGIYIHLIHGRYERCCQLIDEQLAKNRNRVY